MSEDTGVLLVFFNKVDTLKEVFEAIRMAQPKKLFLAQDGQREGITSDIDKINKCREIVDNIDWDCNVYKNYSEKNLTCDPREYSAITWAFQYVDKLIIIEDDTVPNKSFFRFMDEILERYKNDERIHMISGMERLGKNKFCKDSYYFSTINAGCAWGTWKRVWNDIEKWSDCSFVENSDGLEAIEHYVRNCLPSCYHDFVTKGKNNLKLNKQNNAIFSWEYAVATSLVLASRVAITPKMNLVKNIGVVEDATHSGGSLNTMPRKIRRLFFMETHELEFPLRHPQYVMRDSQYECEYEKEFGYNQWDRLCIRIEHLYLLLAHGKIDELRNIIKRKLKRN
jgi:hypothetical protein